LGVINRRLGTGNARVAVAHFGGMIDRDPGPARPERSRSRQERKGIMNADALARSVITRRFRLGELDDASAAAHRRVPAARRHGFDGWLAAELPDAAVQRQVLRALLLDTRVPLTVDARVHDGIVTLSGVVASEWERGHARSSASRVPGVLGIADHLSVLPRSGRRRLVLQP
jgi:osmotically-inducible protein OsmY